MPGGCRATMPAAAYEKLPAPGAHWDFLGCLYQKGNSWGGLLRTPCLLQAFNELGMGFRELRSTWGHKEEVPGPGVCSVVEREETAWGKVLAELTGHRLVDFPPEVQKETCYCKAESGGELTARKRKKPCRETPKHLTCKSFTHLEKPNYSTEKWRVEIISEAWRRCGKCPLAKYNTARCPRTGKASPTNKGHHEKQRDRRTKFKHT